jgi:hypothetical protein
MLLWLMNIFYNNWFSGFGPTKQLLDSQITGTPPSGRALLRCPHGWALSRAAFFAAFLLPAETVLETAAAAASRAGRGGMTRGPSARAAALRLGRSCKR